MDGGMDAAGSLSAESVIDNLGGSAVVSEALSLPISTVSSWRERGIPAKRCLPLARLAADRGQSAITLEGLMEHATKPRPEGAAA